MAVEVSDPSNRNDPAVPATVALGIADKDILNWVRIISLLGIATANIYAFTMTTTGFIETKLLPYNNVFGAYFIAIIVAGFIQAGILAFYLMLPYFQWKKRPVLSAITTTLATSLVVLSAIFALYAITLTAQGKNISAYKTAEINGLNQRLIGLDKKVTETFNRHIGQIDQLRIGACRGRDETGIAKCGPISERYRHQHAEYLTRFGAQLTSPVLADRGSTPDPYAAWTAAHANAEALNSKLLSYSAFARAAGLSSAAETRSLAQIHTEITRIGQTFDGQAPDTKAIVLQRVFDQLRDVLSLRARPAVYFSAFIAILPDLLSLVFACLLSIARSATVAAGSIRRAIGSAEEEASLMTRFADALAAAARARFRWATERRKAAVQDAVDKSVPDA